MLCVKVKSFQHFNVEEVFNENSELFLSVDVGGVCGDDEHGKSSVFTEVCHGE